MQKVLKGFLGLLLLALSLKAEAQTRRVVTYIEDVQEERKQTRWTLTEWLRIKERMKMMDVWLAMFSDPKKDRFAPELSLRYGKGPGLLHHQLGLSSDSPDSLLTGLDQATLREKGQLQFWFTNLVSSTTGLRTLAIDLGLEAEFQNRWMIEPLSQTLSNAESVSVGTQNLQKSSANFRLFGASIQDSSLLLRYGRFTYRPGWQEQDFPALSGSFLGGEMILYLFSWLGLEGEMHRYTPQLSEGVQAEGRDHSYAAFLEVFNLRLGYGVYEQNWNWQNESYQWQTDEKGYMAFARLLL